MNMPHPNDETIVDYAMGNLEDFDARAFERHVAVCVMCGEKLAEEARFEMKLHAIAHETAKVVPITEASPVWRVAPARVVKKRAISVSVVSIVGLAAAIVLAAGVYLGTTFAPPAPLVVATRDPLPAEKLPPEVAPPVIVPPVVVPPTNVSPPRIKAKAEKHPAMAEETTATPKKKDSMGDLIDDTRGAKKATLDRNDVLNTVKANIYTIKACTDAYARDGGKLPPKLVAKWVILPSGRTEAAEVTTEELRYTSCAACVVKAIEKWRFPEFAAGSIPVTFPFPLAN